MSRHPQQAACGGWVCAVLCRALLFSATALVAYASRTEAAPPALAFAAELAVVAESVGSALITVTLSPASIEAVSIDYASINGTALAGSDYSAVSGTLAFAAGETAKTIQIPIADDGHAERDEVFSLTLANPVNASLGTPASQTVTIQDNEPRVRLTVCASVAAQVAITGTDPGVTDYSVALPPGTEVTLTAPLCPTGGWFQRWVEGETTLSESVSVSLTVSADRSVMAEYRARPVYYVNDASTLNDAWCTAVGNDAHDGLTTATPKATVQDVLADYDLEPGDTLRIDTGTYVVTSYINASRDHSGAAGSPVTFAASPYGVTFDGPSGSWCWYMSGSHMVLTTATSAKHPSVPQRWLRVQGAGTGVYVWDDNDLISRCEFRSNSTGIFYGMDEVGHSVHNCLFWGNGTAISIDRAQVSVTQCTLYGNSRAIDMYGGVVWLNNNILWASDATALVYHLDSWFSVYYTGPNDTVATAGASLGFAPGSLEVDPLFVDAAGGDFHLRSRGGSYHGGGWSLDGATSPCLDAGDEAGAYANEPLPNGARANLGAYGNSEQASRSELWVTFAQALSEVGEGSGAAVVEVALSRAVAHAVTVDYTVADGTATAGSDYTATSGTLTFAAGDTGKVIEVGIMADSDIEVDETVVLTLSRPTNAALGGVTQHTLTVLDAGKQFHPTATAGRWCFDEGGGSTTADSSGNGHTGALLGSGLWTMPGVGGAGACLSLAGYSSTTAVTVPHASGLDAGSSICLSAWVNPSAEHLAVSNVLPVISKGTTGTAYGLWLVGDPGLDPALGAEVAFVANQGNSGTPIMVLSEVTVPFGAWSQVAALYDGELVWLFIDGRLVRREAASAPVVNNAEPLTLGLDEVGGSHFLGWIDEVAVQEALPPVVVRALDALPGNGFYKAGGQLDIAVVFARTVTVAGTPRLTLATGAAGSAVDYSSGSGTDTLLFHYTVAAGQNSLDLDVIGSAALALNGGSIRDAYGADVLLALPAPGAAGSLSAQRAVVIDTTAPVVSARLPADNATGVAVDASLVLNFSEAVATGTGNLTIRRKSDAQLLESIPVSDARVTVSDAQVTIHPHAAFAQLTEYYVVVGGTCFLDLAGNGFAGILGATEWTFTCRPTSEVAFAAAAASLAETEGSAVLTVTLSGGAPLPVTVQYVVTGGSATAGMDFAVGGTGTLTFAPGETSQVITVTLFDDALAEADETLAVALADPANAVLGALAVHTLTITDNDSPLAVVTCTADSGAGSLREAIVFANANPGSTIRFAIPGSGVQTIQPFSALPALTAPVLIDGYTQPGARPNTLVTGNDAVLLIDLDGSQLVGGHGLVLEGGNSTVRGLVVRRFRGSGVLLRLAGGNTVAGCFVGTDPTGTVASGNGGPGIYGQAGIRVDGVADNLIGGSTPAARNLVSANGGEWGVLVEGQGAQRNLIQGNYIGTDVAGLDALGSQTGGIGLQATTGNLVGGVAAGERNLVSGNTDVGIEVRSSLPSTDRIEGNYIGTDAPGAAMIGNGWLGNDGAVVLAAAGVTLGGSEVGAGNVVAGPGGVGIFAMAVVQGNLIGTDARGAMGLPNGVGIVVHEGGDDVLIGGSIAGARNIISGTVYSGIVLAAHRARVQGNYIGTDISGSVALPNGQAGVAVSGGSAMLGGTAAGSGNRIAYNDGAGIWVATAARGVSLQGNSIVSNGGLGIDLEPDGVTPNDPGDGDSGANDLQNSPAIEAAHAAAASVVVCGRLDTPSPETSVLEFFQNDAMDSAGCGEGQLYLGRGTPGSDGRFAVALSMAVPVGKWISATATDSAGNTSEFALCVAATASDHDGLPDDWECQYFGSLAQSGADDPDGDGFSNAQEQSIGTNPAAADSAPVYSWTSFVGQPGSHEVSAVRSNRPCGVAVDAVGNVYVAATYDHVIQKVTPAGVVTILAGSPGDAGSADGTGTVARFYRPYSVALDPAGNVFVADNENHTIRKVTPAGVVTTLAGLAGEGGSTDGTGAAARFLGPAGVALDPAGNLLVADYGNDAIRKVTPAGVVTTLAGSAGTYGSADGTGSAARFYRPYGVALDPAGNLLVADYGNDAIRKVTPAGVVTTLAGSAGNPGSADGTGSAAQFQRPGGVALDRAGNLFVADTWNSTIRKVTPAGVVTTLAGSAGTSGSADGTGSAARFNEPSGVALESTGNLLVADTSNGTLRRVTSSGGVTTLTGRAGYEGGEARFRQPYGVAVDSAGNVLVADTFNHVIRRVTPAGLVTILAGSLGYPGSADGSGSAARFNEPCGVALDSAGNLIVADTFSNTIRKVTPAGLVSTLAGSPGVRGSADGLGGEARFSSPYGVAVDHADNVFVADLNNDVIRKVTSAGVVTTLAGTAGSPGSADGSGSEARFHSPFGVAVDGAGNVIVADCNNHTLRQVTPAGVVTTLAGSVGNPGSIDGSGSAVRLDAPCGVAVDGEGNVFVVEIYGLRSMTPAGVVSTLPSVGHYGYSGVAVDGAGNAFVADHGNSRIRKLTPAGQVTTLAGRAENRGSADGTGSDARFYNPLSVAVGSAGDLVVADAWNALVRQVGTGGQVTTLAGSADWPPSSTDGTGGAARFHWPVGVALDGAGNLLVADDVAHTLRRVTPAGVVTTLAGSAGEVGSADGTGSAARFNQPYGVAVDSAGNILVADKGNHTIRKVTPAGVVTTLAGSAGVPGSANGTGSNARFNRPTGVTVDSAGNVFVADHGNHTLRKVTPARLVTTLAGSAGSPGEADGTGTAARFFYPTGVAVDSSGNVLVADAWNNTIRRVTGVGVVTTIGGTPGLVGSADGIGRAAGFANPSGITVDSAGTLFVADADNNRISKGTPISPTFVQFQVAASSVAETVGEAVITVILSGPSPNPITVDYATGDHTAIAGSDYTATSGTLTFAPGETTKIITIVVLDDDLAESAEAVRVSLTDPRNAELQAPGSMLLMIADEDTDADGLSDDWERLYFLSLSQSGLGDPDSDGFGNAQEHAVGTRPNDAGSAPAYSWTTFVGQPGGAGNADGTGEAARFWYPQGVAVDSVGNVIVADRGNSVIRRVTPAGVVSTLAGLAGAHGAEDGVGAAARFGAPVSVAVDRAGNAFVADSDNHTIRKVTPAGVVTTLAGSGGMSGSADGSGSAARFFNPTGVALDSGGNVVVGDYSNHTIRVVTPAGLVTTLAGLAGVSGATDGTGAAARFYCPAGVAVDRDGSVIVADFENHLIRRVSPAGVVTTLAGSAGFSGSTDGTGAAARFSKPGGVTVDRAGTIFVADTWGNALRRVTPAGLVTTLAGLAGAAGSADGTGSIARFSEPLGVTVDAVGNLVLADRANHTIRRVTLAGVVTTLAGSPSQPGSADGTGSAARFQGPTGLALDGGGNLFVADTDNRTIRKVTPAGLVSTVAGSPGQAGSVDGTGLAARFFDPHGVALDSGGTVFVGDTVNHTIRRVTPSGVVSTLAGSPGVSGSADGTGSAARFLYPTGVAVDSAGNLFVSDDWNHTIRQVTPGGAVTTFAGSPGVPGWDDGTGSAARFYYPSNLALDGSGTLFVADRYNSAIRKISPLGVVTSLAGGGTHGVDGSGSAAGFYYPAGVAVDGGGTIFVADREDRTIRRVTPAGLVTTIGGSVGVVGGADGIGRAASFAAPEGIAVDGAGNLYVSDYLNNRVSKGTPIAPPPEVRLQAPDLSVAEAAGSVMITVELSAPSSEAVTVQYATGGGTATVGSDYTACSGALTLAPGATTATITIVIVDDALPELAETLALTLSSPTHAVLGASVTLTLTIIDDETQYGGSGVAAYWRFDEVAGLDAGDAGPNHLTGTLSSADLWSTGGIAGNCLSLGSDWVTTAPDAEALNATTRIGLSAWVHPSAEELLLSNLYPIVVKGTNEVAYGLYLEGDPSGEAELGLRLLFRANVGNGGSPTTAYSTVPVPFGEWSHVAAIYDRTAVWFFVDGVFAGRTLASAPIMNNAESLVLGADLSDGSLFRGLLDEVAVFVGEPPAVVTAVDAGAEDGFYKAGASLIVTLRFTQPVTVSGTPRLTLATGGAGTAVDCSGGSGTDTLSFAYTVAAGHNAADLDVVGSAALALNGATIRDVHGRAALLDLPVPGSAGSLSAARAIAVDTAAPTVVALTPADDATEVVTTADLAMGFGEPVEKGTTGNVVIRRADNAAFETIPVTDARVTVNGNRVTVNPAGTLAASTGYYVLVGSTCLRDRAGNSYAGMGTTTAWAFVTSALPSLQFAAAVSPAQESWGSATVTVTLSAASADLVEVQYATVAGSASAGSDYSNTAGSLSFPPGETTRTVVVSLLSDGLDEADETVAVVLSGATQAILGSPSSHLLTILDDDPPPSVAFAAAASIAGEAAGVVSVAVRLSAVSGLTVTLPYTLAGTATLAADYSVPAGPLLIAPGQTGGTIPVTLVDDGAEEELETVEILMGTPTYASAGALTVHTLTITANDGDHDGLGDAWELLHFGGDADPLDDPDHDGFNNLCEYRDGTDPLAKGSFGAGRHVDSSSGHAYRFYAGMLAWDQAQEDCAFMGGHLATVSSDGENTVVYGRIAVSVAFVWIGGNLDRLGSWRWVSAEAWGFEKWRSGEPSPVTGRDYAGMVGPAGSLVNQRTWSALANDGALVGGYVCEWDYPGDVDGDGLADTWEMRYFGNLLPAPGDDPDGDDLTNLREQTLDSNPTQPDQAYTVSGTAIGGTLTGTGDALANRSAHLVASPDPSPYTYAVDQWLQVLPGEQTQLLQNGGATYDTAPLAADLEVRVTFRCVGGAPAPDPLQWQAAPQVSADTWSAISMSVAPATHPLGVDYRFDLLGPGPARSSGWVTLPEFEFPALEPGTVYTFEARARNRSGDQVATQPTSRAQARTGVPPPSTLEIVEPDGVADFPDYDRNYTIRWRATCELPGATVTFYLDNDDDGFPTFSQILTPVALTPADSGQLMSTTFTALVYADGQYYIWGVLNDAYHEPVRVYSRGPFLITPQDASGIACELLSPPSLPYGQSVRLQAAIRPPVSGLVQFAFLPEGAPAGTKPAEVQAQSSGLTGVAEASWSPGSTGVWEAFAYWPGNTQYSPACSASVWFTVTPSTAQVELVIPRTTMALGTREIGGLLGIVGGNGGVSLAGKQVTLTVMSPTGSLQTLAPACAAAGQFAQAVDFAASGVWSVRAEFLGTQDLLASGPTGWTQISIVQETTYLILCQGAEQAGDPEGLEAHAQTLATIYSKSRDVGLDAEDIHYLTFRGAPAAPERDGTPSMAALETAITDWASARMNAAPAPLYLVLVNHGSIGAFHLGHETLTPSALRRMLDTLQNVKLTDPVAKQQEVVVVLGSCHSGSFVRYISGPRRIVIAAADTWESSYRGASQAGDQPPDGEYFVSSLFHELTRSDNSLFAAFQVAAPAARERATCTVPVQPPAGPAWVEDLLRFQHRVDYVIRNDDDTYTYRFTSAAFGSQGGVPKPLSQIVFELPDGVNLVGQPSSQHDHAWNVGPDAGTGLDGVGFVAGSYHLGAQLGVDETEWFQFSADRLLDRVVTDVRAVTSVATAYLPVPVAFYDAESVLQGGYPNNVIATDNSQQHPLLEDDGDGIGSHYLTSNSGDGLAAQRIYFGTQRNAAGDLSLVRVRESLCLSRTDPAPELWAEYSRPAGEISSGWIELKPPNFGGAATGGTMQYDMNLSPLLATEWATAAGTQQARATWVPDRRGSPYDSTRLAGAGLYQVLYYGQLSGATDSVGGRQSWVFRASGLTQPAAFGLLTPAGSETVVAPAAFTWEPSSSAGGQVQYLFRLWRDSSSTVLHYEAPLSTAPLAVLGHEHLPNGEYWWEVIAVDAGGNSRRSELRQVVVDTPNSGTVAMLLVKVYDESTRLPVAGATLTLNTSPPVSLDNGACARSLALGFYTLRVSAGAQYVEQTRQVTLAGGVRYEEFALQSAGTRYLLTLQRGWNLISLPIQPYDNAVADVLTMAGTETPAYRVVYGWDGAGFHPATTLDALRGYWVYCAEGCRIEVVGQVVRAPRFALAAGWHLVGASTYWEWYESRATTDKCLGWAGSAYRTLRAQAEPETDLMVPGAAYWLYLDAPAEVELGP